MAVTRIIELDHIWYPGFLPEDAVELDDRYPPIIVVPDGVDSYELIDGYHRLAAARVSGRRTIRAVVVSHEEYRLMETMGEDEWIEAMQEAAR